MTKAPEDPAIDLGKQICTELTAPEPAGFHFTDAVLRQDEALERLVAHLGAHGDRSEVERAISYALSTTQDGWIQLKLLELTDRLHLLGTAPALLAVVRQPETEDLRRNFLKGRACEILLRLPLNVEMRNATNEACALPLQRIATYRLGAASERAQQRPRRLEWLLLAALMALAILGVIFALMSLDRA